MFIPIWLVITAYIFMGMQHAAIANLGSRMPYNKWVTIARLILWPLSFVGSMIGVAIEVKRVFMEEWKR